MTILAFVLPESAGAGEAASGTVSPWLGLTLYTVVALIWLIPDLRIERALAEPTE